MLDKARLENILGKFHEKNIAVIGDIMLDEYIIGKVTRISPEAPVPVVNVTNETFVLGGAANVINNLHSLNVKVAAFGVIGSDINGDKLYREFTKRGVNIEGLIEDKERPTTIKKRIICQNQQLLRLDWENKKNIDSYTESRVIEIFKQKIGELDAIILSDYNKGFLTKRLVTDLIKIANEHNKIIIVDPKPENIENYRYATSMTPNTKEAIECINGREFETEDEFREIGKKILERYNLKNLLITRSEKGMSIFTNDDVLDIPTFAKEIYDVTGAGDTVISVYTLALSAGATYEEAAKIANVAAGIVVGRVGTATVNVNELREFYEKIYI